jgi:cyclophilin family peptidyl-prolyl cis-trans isomerase
MRPVIGFTLLILIAAGVLLLTSPAHKSVPPAFEDTSSPQNTAPQTKGATKTFEEVTEGAIKATLEIEGRGTMQVELYPKAAPKTVEQIVKLCKQNFYKDILFHRVVSGFVAQAGDPGSKKHKPSELKGLSSDEVGAKFQLGSGGTGASVPLETGLPHAQFSLGMARSSDPNSGDCQFYINLNANHNLDAEYCVFGRIVSGEEIAATIEIGDKITRFSVP